MKEGAIEEGNCISWLNCIALGLVDKIVLYERFLNKSKRGG